MPTKAIGVDSATFYHSGKIADFKAPLGVAVETTDYDLFHRDYLRIISSLKSKYGLDTERTCLKGHFILDKLKERGCDFINDFVTQILPSLKMILVCHTVISEGKVPEIFCCNGTKKISTPDFINRLLSSYEHIVIWKLLQDFPDTHDANIFSDYFTGVETKAWQDLESNKNLSVFSAGEYCNPIISTADLICKYINDSLNSKNVRLGSYGISDVFQHKSVVEISLDMNETQIDEMLKDDKTKLYQRFPFALSHMTPVSFRRIEVDSKLKHPVIYILPSHKLPKERQAMEHTRLYDLLTNLAYESNGCLRSINLDEIHEEIKYMQSGDIIVTVGDSAEEKAKYMRDDLLIPVKIISSKNLLEK